MPPTNDAAAASSAGTGTVGANRSMIRRRRTDELPLQLIEKILNCISPLELVRLSTVCKSWAAIISDRLAAGLVPHLFVCKTPKDKPELGGLVVSVALDGARHPSAAAFPARLRRADMNDVWPIGATPCGRFAFSRFGNAGVFLVNPVTGVSQTVNLGVLLQPNTAPVLVTGGGVGVDDSFFCSASNTNIDI